MGTYYTILGICLIFFGTTLGSAISFIFKHDINVKLNSIILGASAGIMLAASIFGLLLPSLEQSSDYGTLSFLPASVGVLLGAFFLIFINYIGKKTKNSSLKHKNSKMFLAVLIHNIPEGIAVGASFGSAFMINEPFAFTSAMMLAFGIAMQNIPEGMAVSLPISRSTGNRFKGFYMGVLSGVVEPVFAIMGFFLASRITFIMPWLLAFACGNMLLSVVDDLIPESKIENSSIGVISFIFGFIIMMILDVVL